MTHARERRQVGGREPCAPLDSRCVLHRRESRRAGRRRRPAPTSPSRPPTIRPACARRRLTGQRPGPPDSHQRLSPQRRFVAAMVPRHHPGSAGTIEHESRAHLMNVAAPVGHPQREIVADIDDLGDRRAAPDNRAGRGGVIQQQVVEARPGHLKAVGLAVSKPLVDALALGPPHRVPVRADEPVAVHRVQDADGRQQLAGARRQRFGEARAPDPDRARTPTTRWPRSARIRAAAAPAGPPPMIATSMTLS